MSPAVSRKQQMFQQGIIKGKEQDKEVKDASKDQED